MKKNLIKEIEKLRDEALAEAANASGGVALEAVRVKYLGRKGLLTALLRRMKDVSAKERPAVGKAGNETKVALEAAFASRQEAAGTPARPAGVSVDFSLPGRDPGFGRRHPVTLVTDEIVSLFHAFGFSVVTGPEIETEFYNFESLNTPADHPARDEQDSFYTVPGRLLRTQTTAMQCRILEREKPPVRALMIGRCYRRDPFDASHSPMFHQIDGLLVDDRVRFSDLKGMLQLFARELFGADQAVRFRPSFFPFTEPSAEMDVRCAICRGKGCGVCKGSGWVELLGCGMVDPAVFEKANEKLEAAGNDFRYSPEVHTGFAFGMGPDRIAMMRYGINDIRLLYENDRRFLEQF